MTVALRAHSHLDVLQRSGNSASVCRWKYALARLDEARFDGLAQAFHTERNINYPAVYEEAGR